MIWYILGGIGLAVIAWAVWPRRRALELPLEIGETGTYLVMPSGQRRKLLDHPASPREIDEIRRMAERVAKSGCKDDLEANSRMAGTPRAHGAASVGNNSLHHGGAR